MFFECSPVDIHNYGLLFSLFLGGLVGGLSHCTFMCAPFVLSMQRQQIGRISSVLLLPYHVGRMTTYVVLGVLAHLFLSYAFPTSQIRTVFSAVFLLMAALLFLVQAIPVLGVYMPFLMKIHIPAPFAFLQASISRLLNKQNKYTLYLTGVLLGFIPCGLVMGALLAASTAETPWKAGLAMVLFAIGTMPSLIMVALGGRTLATLLPRGGALLSRWVLVVNGVILLVLAGRLLWT
jgi:sulfite exporter TauE/SafE